MVVGIDSTGGAVGGFDAASWTDPLIVGDADGNGVLTGADAALVAQKSVQLPTPQIPNLPGIPLVPNGGGSLALDDLAPQTASAQASSNPPAAVGVLVESLPPPTATARPNESTSSATRTATLLAAAPLTDRLVIVAPADWSPPALQPLSASNGTPLAATPSTVSAASDSSTPVSAEADSFFIQLADDHAADESSAPLNVDSAIDDYYAELAPTNDAESWDR